MNPTEKFQSAIIGAVKEAAMNGVHPAVVYTVLGGVQSDVLYSIKEANRAAKKETTDEQPNSSTELSKSPSDN